MLAITHVELDALQHGPDWQPRAAFADDVDAFSRQPSWVTEWSYPSVRGLLAGRADLMVWLDLPRSVVMQRVIRRTLRRAWHREELWNGNREPGLYTILTDPEHIIRWSWRTHPNTATQVAAAAERHPELPVVRLRSASATADWLAGPVSNLAR